MNTRRNLISLVDTSYTDLGEWDGESAGSVRDERLYYCTDHQGSVVALVGPDGALAEQARYSANGVPFGLPRGDVDADGDCDGADDTLVKAIGAGAYDVRGDLDLDGDVDSADEAIVQANAGEVLGWGRLSAERVRSVVAETDGETSANDLSWKSARRPILTAMRIRLLGACGISSVNETRTSSVAGSTVTGCASPADRMHPDPLLDCGSDSYDPSVHCCVGGRLIPVTTEPPGVQLCLRPLQVFSDLDPYCVVTNVSNVPATHCYLWFPGWSAGFQSDSTVWIPERMLRVTDRVCWSQPRRVEGSLPDGTPCRCASADAIRNCIKTQAAVPQAQYNLVTNNCCHWALRAVAACCMDITHPGYSPSPFGAYPPNPRKIPIIWR